MVGLEWGAEKWGALPVEGEVVGEGCSPGVVGEGCSLGVVGEGCSLALGDAETLGDAEALGDAETLAGTGEFVKTDWVPE